MVAWRLVAVEMGRSGWYCWWIAYGDEKSLGWCSSMGPEQDCHRHICEEDWKEPGLVTSVGRKSSGFVLVMLNLKWPIRHLAKTKNQQLGFRGTVRAGHWHSGQNRTKPIKKETEKATTDLRWTSVYKWILVCCYKVSAKEKAAIGISLSQLYVKEHKVWKSIQSF